MPIPAYLWHPIFVHFWVAMLTEKIKRLNMCTVTATKHMTILFDVYRMISARRKQSHG